MDFNDCSVKEPQFSHYKEISQVIKTYIKEINLALQKLVSKTTNRASVMFSSDVDFITLCKNDAEFLIFFHYHCIIHQKVLCKLF